MELSWDVGISETASRDVFGCTKLRQKEGVDGRYDGLQFQDFFSSLLYYLAVETTPGELGRRTAVEEMNADEVTEERRAGRPEVTCGDGEAG